MELIIVPTKLNIVIKRIAQGGGRVVTGNSFKRRKK